MALAAKQKKKHLKAMHQKVKLFRAKEPLLSVFMWGINHSINELNHINVPVMLMPDDFKAFSKLRVDNHLYNKENMPSHFKFKEYCPVVFRNLRERFEVDDEVFLNSLSKMCPNDTDSPGRSGARFLSSYDRRFVIKTITSEEVAEMHRILKDYHQHIVEWHAESLLPQYLGMYRITVNDVESYLLVMRNIFSPRITVHKKYDLKGSTVDRQASDKEKAKELPTFKDNDFVSDGIKINIGDETKEKLLLTIQRDVDFLAKLNLMDYSLLVGIHDVEQAAEEQDDSLENDDENGVEEDEDSAGSLGASGGAANVSASVPTPPDSPSCPPDTPRFTGDIDPDLELFALKSNPGGGRNEIYFMALIDILTHYGAKKRTAQAVKTVKHGAGAEISTVKPEQYSRRFVDFISKVLE
jgi:1-phosphatidylinositol-5-phosphate 4-kinase